MFKKLDEAYHKYKEIIDYLIFGGFTTLVNVVVFFLFDTVIGLHYLMANAISIAVAILFAYYTNQKFVFRSRVDSFQERLREFGLFVILRLFSAVFDMLSMWVLVDLLEIDSTLAKLLTQFIVVVSNYVFSKFFIFKQKEDDNG